jgi:hypothetical protein
MSNLTKKEMPDRSKINLHQPLEVKHWSKQLGVDKQRLHEVVEKVGDSAAAIRKELTPCEEPATRAAGKT